MFRFFFGAFYLRISENTECNRGAHGYLQSRRTDQKSDLIRIKRNYSTATVWEYNIRTDFKKADVNIGTIVYHFKSIENIGPIVYEEFWKPGTTSSWIKSKTHPRENATDTILSLWSIGQHGFLFKVSPLCIFHRGSQLPQRDMDIKDLKRTSIKLAKRPTTLYRRRTVHAQTSVSCRSRPCGQRGTAQQHQLTAKQICDYHTRVRLLSLNVGEEGFNPSWRKWMTSHRRFQFQSTTISISHRALIERFIPLTNA